MSPNNIYRLSRNIFEHDYVPDAVPKIKELMSTSWWADSAMKQHLFCSVIYTAEC